VKSKEDEKSEWLHCNTCGRDTNHIMVHNHRNKEFVEKIKDEMGRPYASVDGFHDWQLLECQGCKTVFLRSREYFSEWSEPWDEDPYKTAYFPRRNVGSRVKPHWFDTFINLDGVKGHFILISYQQIYQLIEAEKYLAAMLTSRALLETLAVENSGGDNRTFKAKLQALADKELIRSKQINFLDNSIYDAGSAAMHRGYNPSSTAVTHVLDAIEQLIYTIYIEPLVDETLQAEKPKREKRG
jgi:hypothetical protein